MPKQTTAGKWQFNHAIAPETYALLVKYADGKKGYGRVIEQALQVYDQVQQAGGLVERRLSQLEAQVAALVSTEQLHGGPGGYPQ